MKKALLLIAALGVVSAANADVLLFDNVSNYMNAVAGAGASTTSSTPNTFMGDAYNLNLTGGSTTITGFDLFPANLAGTTFTNLKLTVYVWGTVNTTGTVNSTTPAFSNLLSTVTAATGTGSYPNGSFFPFDTGEPGTAPGLTLSTPITLTGSQIGLTFNYQGSTDNGVTYNSVNGLTSLITTGTAPTVGSNVFNGYYRNAGTPTETNGNFTSSLRSLGGTPVPTNQSIGVRVFGNTTVPEPATLAALGMGALALIRRRKKA